MGNSPKYSNKATKNEEECSYGKFYCMVSKIWKNIVFYVATEREKNDWVVLFLNYA